MPNSSVTRSEKPEDPAGSPTPPTETEAEDVFHLTRGWLFVGIFAALVGVLAGLIMSGATFIR